HHEEKIVPPWWNDFFLMMERYFCHDGTILLSYLFGLIKACAILKKRRRCVRMIFSYHSDTPSFAIKRVSLFLLRRGIV
ncbi:hypothetical protein, partial [Bacteroides uniformis]|uniref:hypothetical protein n=2 Tax=Bacteroides uniformis TaxID=820 RepID=UPI001E65B43A